MAPINEFSKAIGAAADTVGPSVVGLGRGWGLGSGVVVGDGRVLTNAHNVRRDEPTVVFADDRREAASILAASARAASTYVGSFHRTSAWSGVFVAGRRAVHFSRSGASNVASDAGGTVRFQKVYMVRRYRSLP